MTSHHPLAHKLAVPRTLFIRAQRLCSNPLDRANEEKHLEATLLTNGYPRRLIHQTFSRTRSIPQTEKEPLETTVVIPYIHRVSEPIRRILAPLNIRTCFRPHRTLRNILTQLVARGKPIYRLYALLRLIVRLIASWNGTGFCFLLFSGQGVVYILERSRTKQLLKGFR